MREVIKYCICICQNL